MHTIPLATFTWQRTRPRIEVHSHSLNLALPSRLGDLPWMLPRDEVAVVDTRDQIAELDDGLLGRGPHDFAHLNVPYLATTTAAVPPTTGLLFRHRRSHPALGTIDGVLVREAHPGQLIDLAAGLGMETATGLQWFADHRRAVPPRVASARSAFRRVESVGVASAAAGGGLFFLAAGQNMHHRTGRVGIVMLLAGSALAVVTDRLGRHRADYGDQPADSRGVHAAVRVGQRLEGHSSHVSS